MLLTTRVFEFAGTLSEKAPSAEVIVPVVVPLIDTETPERGTPLSSVTTPVTVRCCAIEVRVNNINSPSKSFCFISKH